MSEENSKSADNRERIVSLIAPVINNMFNVAMNEDLMENLAKNGDKRQKKR
jgi:hypothetical protein